ncbi:MAG: TrkA family potassium uptake protein [Clostridiales bacterium]|nr:TrkA family potassium uptake protein [Clostridiales bacterium]
MKNILIIGLGRFGKHLAEKFIELGDEVMVVDRDEDAVQSVMDMVTYAQIGDCKKETVLKSLGVNNFDLCFVCIGSDFQSSLEITALLKDFGAKYVISKAGRDIHAKFLLRNGADEIVYPEKDMAARIAVKFSSNYLVDYFEISADAAIYEILVPEGWVGKSIGNLNVRSKYKINILAVRKKDGELDSNPVPDRAFGNNEQMIVLGMWNDVKKILK